MADATTKIAVGEVRPLTIPAGANSPGKSSIMQPLLSMKQTLEQTFDLARQYPRDQQQPEQADQGAGRGPGSPAPQNRRRLLSD